MTTSGRILARSGRYRRVVAARFVSNLGNGITPIAMAFGVLDLEGATPTSLSIVLAAQAIPLVLLLPIGGVVADRFGRALVMGVSDIALSVFIFIMAALFITGTATVPVLAGLMLVYGALAAAWYPAMSGLVPDVVPDEHLQPANAFVSVATNTGLIIGSALGGLLVATLGSGIAIAIDAASFLLAGLLVVSLRTPRSEKTGESMYAELAHGWRVFWSYRWVVIIVAAFSLIVMSYRGSQEVMGPVLAKAEYGGPAGWAVILAFESAGMLAGGLLATRLRVKRPLVVGMLVMFTQPALQLMFAFALPLPVVATGAFFFGLAMDLFFVLWLSTMQAKVPRDALSRVSSYDAMGSLMFGPIGLALAGPLVALVGVQQAFIVAAVISAVPIALSFIPRSVRQLHSVAPGE